MMGIINTITIVVMVLMFVVLYTLSFMDWRKKRTLKSHPLISFIIPCYNDGDTIEGTIKTLYQSYDNFELFIVNDCSKDDSLEVLKKLQKIHKFKLLSNEVNKGKAKSINDVVAFTKGEIVFVVDADTYLSEKAINDILKRFDHDAKVGAVSCPYKAKNKGFFPLMQSIEYNMLSLVQFAHNIHSTLSLWGGCLAVKREALIEAGLFSENAIVEDMDLALKLNKNKWRVEQGGVFVHTDVPEKFKVWWKQKIRWSSGGMQCIIKFICIYLKNPIYMLFFIIYWFMIFLFLVSILKSAVFFSNLYNLCSSLHSSGMLFWEIATQLKVLYGLALIKGFLVKFAFVLFSIPYVIPLMKTWKDWWKIIYTIPFSFVYIPIFTVVSINGLIKGAVQYKKLARAKRAW